MASLAEPPPLRPLTRREFERFRQLARDTIGLDLRDGKEPLVAARLGKVAGRLQLHSYQEYYDYVTADRTGQALLALIEALTTHHTGFLREPAHFEFLAQIAFSEWRTRDQIRIWSAGCSSGEEAYSIAFHLLDCGALPDSTRIDIFATDISSRMLEIARAGVYPAERLAHLPPHWLSKYLLKGHGRSAGLLRVKPEIQRLITFERLNLVEPFPPLAPFSVIFCRNVMIYFDRPTQESLVIRAATLLEPGGYLFIGHSESLLGLEQPLTYVQPAIYRKSLYGSSPHTQPARERKGAANW
jgi:chemotaxis protein methyltransferase CheR